MIKVCGLATCKMLQGKQHALKKKLEANVLQLYEPFVNKLNQRQV